MTIRTGFLLVNDERTSALHAEHFNDPTTTDTMSFPINQANPDGEYYLGDIVVNYDQLQRQATDLSIPEREELARLITHSALHLLGFDDGREDDAQAMRDSENRVVAKLLPDAQDR